MYIELGIMSDFTDDVISSGLSEAVLEKAKRELGEKPEWRQRDIQALRDIIKSDLSLYCPHDDAFLLMFLRAKKFDYEKAAKLIRRYYEVRVEYKDFYAKFRPSTVKMLYDQGLYVKLPTLKETDPQPLLLRPGKWDPSVVPMDSMLRGNLMQVEKLIRMEEKNQVNGLILLMDMGEMTWNQAKNMNPFVAKRVTSIIQQAMPCRLKAIHYVNVPHFFEYVFAIVKQFLSDKLRSRVHIHATPEYLKEHFDLSVLPTTFGGTLDLEPLISEWAKTMADSEQEFISWEKYGIKEVETVSDAASSSADPVGGITGTFKKLNTD